MGRRAAHPEGGGEQVRPGPQVGDGTQVLHAVALLLQGVVRGGDPLHLNRRGLHLQGLLGLGGEHQRAGDDEGRAHVLGGDVLIVVQGIGVHHHLQVPEAGAVVELDEPEGLHVPDGAGPAAHGDGLAVQPGGVGVEGSNFDSFHIVSPILLKLGVFLRIGVLYRPNAHFTSAFPDFRPNFPRHFLQIFCPTSNFLLTIRKGVAIM